MTPQEIREIADHPEVPTFIFGSEALKEWTRQNVDQNDGVCWNLAQSFYVVVHPSINGSRSPTFRVLSRWEYGQRVPRTWDIDDTIDGPLPHEVERIEA